MKVSLKINTCKTKFLSKKAHRISGLTTPHTFLIQALGGGEWSASSCGHFTTGEDSLITTGLDVLPAGSSGH